MRKGSQERLTSANSVAVTALTTRRRRILFCSVAGFTLVILAMMEKSLSSEGSVSDHAAGKRGTVDGQVGKTVQTSSPPALYHHSPLFSSVAASIIAGALTGIVETLLMYPLENLKTQQQLDSKPILELAKRTIATFGFFGLYRGIVPILIGAIPTQAIRWGSYEFVCSLRGCDTIGQVAVAGVVSGIFVAVATGIPMESMKTHMIHTLHTPSTSPAVTPQPESGDHSQYSHHRPISTSATGGSHPAPLPSTPTKSSVLGTPLVFKGWAPTIFKKVLNQSIRFPVHKFFLGVLCAGSCAGEHHMLKSFVAGALAGLSSIIITQPVDVVKTRMQGLGSERYGHSLNCAVTLLREEGLLVFMDGIAPRSLRVALGAGITFSVFPMIKAIIARL